MGSLGMQEIIIIFILALIVFGPRKLPELGKSLGKSLAEFKKASNELKQTWEEEVRLDRERQELSDIMKDDYSGTYNPPEKSDSSQSSDSSEKSNPSD